MTTTRTLPTVTDEDRALAARVRTITFARHACGRCGGSGKMPFAVWGGKCFKCAGAGTLPTTRGAKAQEAIRAALASCQKPASAFLVGESVEADGRLFKIRAIATTPDGQVVLTVKDHLVAYAGEMPIMCSTVQAAPEALLRRAPTPDEWAQVIALARQTEGAIVDGIETPPSPAVAARREKARARADQAAAARRAAHCPPQETTHV
jgi:hypothetical protein